MTRMLHPASWSDWMVKLKFNASSGGLGSCTG